MKLPPALADLGLREADSSDPADVVKYRNRGCYTLDESGALSGLNLCGLPLGDDQLGFLAEIPTLRALNLSENERITQLNLPDSLRGLEQIRITENPNLRHLRLPAALPALRRLELQQNKLVQLDLPAGMKRLHTLYAQKNALETLHFGGDCAVLEFLDLSDNQLSAFTLPQGFGHLKYLYLNNNRLETLDFHNPLGELDTLHLKNNQISRLPDRLMKLDNNLQKLRLLPNLQMLYLGDNPLQGISVEVVGESSLPGLINYLRSGAKSHMLPLHQAKMILVGNGEVGKSSIRIRLLDKEAPLPKKEDRTPGLDIAKYTVKEMNAPPKQPFDFQLNIWDFGGQGKYREVQQLFCSRKSLYLFVTSCDDDPSRDDYVGFEYWLSMVSAYGHDMHTDHASPVVHVLNKIDLEYKPIDEERRRNLFPNIHPEFVRISCETLENFDDLENVIREVLPSVSPDIFTTEYSEFWLNVKNTLEGRQGDNHITHETYLDICRDNGLDDSEAQTWIEVLDRIGTVIYFGADPVLRDWVILNPSWVKDAIYKVLDSPLPADGILKPAFHAFIWPDYTPEEREKLLALMQAYKICYARPEHPGEYVVPALLPDTRRELPAHLQNPRLQLRLCFDPLIPAGTVNKLMVERNEMIYNNLCWRNNVIFHDPRNNAYALVSENWDDKMVYIDLFGADTRALFELLRDSIAGINQRLKDTKFLRQIDFQTDVWYEEEWMTLRQLEKLHIQVFSLEAEDKSVSEIVRTLFAQGREKDGLEFLQASLPEQHKNAVVPLLNALHNAEGQFYASAIDYQALQEVKSKAVQGGLDLLQFLD